MKGKGSHNGYVFKNYQLIVEYRHTQDFIRSTRIKYHIPEGGFGNDEDYFEWLNKLVQDMSESGDKNLSRYSDFLSDISSHTRNNNITKHWNAFLRLFIAHDITLEAITLRSGSHTYSPKISIESDGINGYQIVIKIDANTRRQDLIDSWATIKKLQKKLPEYRLERKRRNIERDLILKDEVEENGKTLTQEIYSELSETLVENKDKATLAKAINRIKKETSRQ